MRQLEMVRYRQRRFDRKGAVRKSFEFCLGARTNRVPRRQNEVLTVAEYLVEGVVRDEDIADLIFHTDGRFVTAGHVHREARRRCAQRQRAAVGELQRLEEDIDEPVRVQDIGLGGVDDADRCRRPRRNDFAPIENDRAL